MRELCGVCSCAWLSRLMPCVIRDRPPSILVMRTSDVVFNEAGRSIESSCMIFKNKKWRECYMMCCQPKDIRNVFLIVYKNHKNRLKNKELFVITFDSFVGFESGFVLKKERNTLCVITRCDVVIAAFASIENLICWESWLHQTCCQGAMLYAQLIDAPESSRARSLLNREVRIHIHDGRFALVEGRPPRVIGFWNVNDILRASFRHNVMHFITVDGLSEDEGVFALVCGQIQQLARFFHLARKPGLLVSFLNRKTADGPWMNTLRTSSSSASYPIYNLSDSRFDTLSENGDSTSHMDIACEARNGTRKWDDPSGRASQPSVSITKSGSSTPEGDFTPTTSESRELSSPPVSQKVSHAGVVVHQHGRISPQLQLYMNYEVIANNLTKASNVAECSAFESTSSSRHPNGYFDYVNVSNASSTSKSGVLEFAYLNGIACGIRRAASDMPYYMNINDTSCDSSFSTEILASRFSAYGSALNQCMARPEVNARAFNSELSIASARVNESNGTVEPLCCENTPPGQPSSSRKIVCRAGSWPKHVYNLDESAPTVRHLSTCSIGGNGYVFGSGRIGLRSSNAKLPGVTFGEASDYERKVVNTPECRGKYLRQQQKTARSRGRDAASFRDKSRISQHQRSRSVGLEATVKRSGSTREENWDRAKRIIGGVRKSVNGSRNAMQSASLDKLIISPSASSRSGLPHCGVAVEASNPPAAEKIPRLDVSVNVDTTQNTAVASASIQGPSPIPGLVKLPPERFGLKKMSNILTKSLRKSVTGSYSKYDGERATHHYNPGDANELLLPPVVDCIESAVNKGRARLIEADRRNSSFAEGIHSTHLNTSTRMPRRYTFTVQTTGALKPCAVSARTKKEGGGDSEGGSFTSSHTLSNCSVGAQNAHVSPAATRSMQSRDMNGMASPPPLPPKTYLKKKAVEESRIAVVGESVQAATTAQPSSATRRPLQGNYCAIVAANSREPGTSQKTSHEDAHTVYTQIDPIATLAATQTQADMMKERERQVAGRLVGQSAYASDRALGVRKKRSHGSDDRPNVGRSFFSRRIWRKPSKTRSHSDLRF